MNFFYKNIKFQKRGLQIRRLHASGLYWKKVNNYVGNLSIKATL